MPLLSAGFPKGVYGIGVRDQLDPGEDEFFKANPHVAGMAADDDKIITNPYSKLKEDEMRLLMMNEAARVHMRKGLMERPNFEITQEQLDRPLGGGKLMKDYSEDMNDIRQTIAARILTGDPSAGQPTQAQQEYVSRLRQFMGVK
jgi:hypothetical protein